MSSTFRISQCVLDGILAAARHAGNSECMGLLAAAVGERQQCVSAACLLPAEASGSHAEADAETISTAMTSLLRRRLRPVGLWHSHGSHAVFHSGTDDATVTKLFPAMAAWNFERPRAELGVPAITGCDTASVPLGDGRTLRILLAGPKLPGIEGNERVSWSRMDVLFAESTSHSPVILDGLAVKLMAGGVCLELGIPDGANVVSEIEDHAAVRSAKLFSLVVNRRGEKYAEALTVHDICGESHIAKRCCEIAVLMDDGDCGGGVSWLGSGTSLLTTSMNRSRTGRLTGCREGVS